MLNDDRNIQDRPIAIVTAGGMNPQVMINALARHFNNITVIQEAPESKAAILKRRARNLGWLTAVGQLGTMIVSRLGKNFAAKRQAEILREYGVSDQMPETVEVIRIASINSPDFIDAINRAAPEVIFTISCRLLNRQTLTALKPLVINFHAGVTPEYRGQMGGYWALVNRDRERFGATVHLVDAGVDTGDVLYRKTVAVSRSDSMLTYPLLLTAACTDIAEAAITEALKGETRPCQPAGQSGHHYPPPLWTYLWNALSKGVL